MLPYYSFPFSYIDRNSAGMAQQPVPYVMPAASPLYPMEQIPEDLPMTPQMPQQMPGMQQNMPVQQVMPIQQFPNPNTMPNMYGVGMNNGYTPHADRPEDLAPILSNNPPVTAISLFKELTAYPNYGNPSGNADILYTGDRGVWTFDIPAFLFIPGNLTGELVIRGVLDDMDDVAVNRYSARITINGTVVHTGRVPLVHGRPVGGRFNNWRELRFSIPNIRRNNRVVIENTSNAGANNWITFDWMELRLIPRR